MSLTIGIDIGGTFTDVVGYDDEARRIFFTKVPSTPGDLSAGFMAGVDKMLGLSGLGGADLGRLAHSTTTSLNAILEQKGARVGIITTAGFEDLLVIGRQKRSAMYDFFLDAETPTFLCPRRRIIGVRERIGGDGSVVTPLDEEEVRAAAKRLVKTHRVECIVVFYLMSFLDPTHERRTAEIVREAYPDMRVSVSSAIDPRFREYERLCVTAFDAYVRPVIESYVSSLERRLSERGAPCRLQIMQSRGGISNAGSVVEKPVTTIMSGPAAAVVAAGHLGAQMGRSNLLVVDIGGTSCDIALVSRRKPMISLEGEIRHYPVRQPMIDVNSIGAGGGSIAWVDAAGGMRVGPQSAGSRPGPAAYGAGGTEPTVTDASLVLGYLNPAEFGCGEITLDPAKAADAVAGLAARLGLGFEETALGIHRIINAKMAEEMRLVSIKRGHDPRRFAIVAGGGGGSVHAGRLAEHLGVPEIVVPLAPGCLAALGLLVANIEHDHGATFRAAAGSVDLEAFGSALAVSTAACAARMRADDADPTETRTHRFAGMRYVGQSFELEVELPGEAVDLRLIETAVGAFHAEHERIYGHADPAKPVEFVTLRVVQSYALPKPAAVATAPDGTLADARKGRRKALFDLAAGPVEVEIYDRRSLPVDARMVGPAIIEQEDCTTVLYPGHALRVERDGTLIISLPANG